MCSRKIWFVRLGELPDRKFGAPHQCPILPIGKHVLGQEGVSKRIHRPSNCSPSSRQRVSRETQNGTEHQEAFTGVKITNYHSTPTQAYCSFSLLCLQGGSALRPCKHWLCFACAKALLEHIKCPCSPTQKMLHVHVLLVHWPSVVCVNCWCICNCLFKLGREENLFGVISFAEFTKLHSEFIYLDKIQSIRFLTNCLSYDIN